MSRVLPLFVFGSVFVFCLVLAAPGLTWLDGGELALAAGTMGVAHPPGEPAWLVLARLAALVPVGDLPFRLTLLSAATVATAAALLSSVTAAFLAGRASGQLDAMAPSADTAGLVAGLSFGIAPAAVLQGVRPELYGLCAALLLAGVRSLQAGGRRGLALAVLPLCVAGAVHHAMLVAALPGLALLAWGRGRGSLRAGLAAAGLLLLPGLLQFAWLPLRSMARPALDFGTPDSLGRVLFAVTAAGYRRSFVLAPGQLGDNLFSHLGLLPADLGLPVLLLGAAGLVAACRRPRLVPAGLALVLVGALPTVLQGVFDPDNPDARGYLLGPFAVVCAAAGLGAAALEGLLRRKVPGAAAPAAFALVVAALVPPGRASTGTADQSGCFLPARLGSAVLDGAEPGALVLCGGDSWAFPPLYLRYWEGRRPDLHVVPLHMLEPAALPGLAARGVPLPAALSEGEAARLATVHRGMVPEHLLSGLVRGDLVGTTVLVNDVFLPIDLLRRRSPDGLLYRLDGAAGGGAAEELLWHRTMEPSRRDVRYLRDRIGQGVVGRRFGARGAFLRGRGRYDEAGLAWRRGGWMQPDPRAMIQLMRWRHEQGLEGSPPHGLSSVAVERAAAACMAGWLDEAAREVRRALAIEPVCGEALLLAERLHSLGVKAASPVPMPGEPPR